MDTSRKIERLDKGVVCQFQVTRQAHGHFPGYRATILLLESDCDPNLPCGTQTAKSRSAAGATVAGVKLDRAERQRVMDGVIRNLKEHYIDPDAAQKMKK
ncbi:MAG TPA: hypothetical protein VKU44_06780 [Terriglobia bacterium]|nr:hypothetical protein [Terriglobia bacterium]